jgi:hypothetical protein
MRCVASLLLLVAGAAHAQGASDALRKCAAIVDASERLKCHDAVSQPSPAARQLDGDDS